LYSHNKPPVVGGVLTCCVRRKRCSFILNAEFISNVEFFFVRAVKKESFLLGITEYLKAE